MIRKYLERDGDVVVWGLCILVLVVFAARASLASSFWLDETLSFWLTSGTLTDVWRRGVLFQGQGPLYYALLWCWRQCFGGSEIALRSLSVLCCCGSFFVMWRLVVLLRVETVVAVGACAFVLASDPFQDALLSVRPYSFAILIASISLWCTFRLREQFSQARLAALLVSMIVIFYSHWMFALIMIPHLVLVRAQWRRVIAAWPLLFIALVICIPGLSQIVRLSSKASGLVFVQAPSWIGVLKGAVPIPACTAVLVGGALAAIWGGRVRVEDAQRSSVRALFAYVVWAPLPFLCISLFGASSLWVSRYWAWHLVPLGLLGAIWVASFAPRHARTLALVVFALFLIARVATQRRIGEGWREVAQFATKESGPVLLYSGLVEVESGVVDRAFEGDEYVRAPLRVYGVNQEIRVVGMRESEQSIISKMKDARVLVAQRHRRSEANNSDQFTSPERFKLLAAQAGLDVEQELKEGTLTAFLLKRRGG